MESTLHGTNAALWKVHERCDPLSTAAQAKIFLPNQPCPRRCRVWYGMVWYHTCSPLLLCYKAQYLYWSCGEKDRKESIKNSPSTSLLNIIIVSFVLFVAWTNFSNGHFCEQPRRRPPSPWHRQLHHPQQRPIFAKVVYLRPWRCWLFWVFCACTWIIIQ